LLLQWALVVFGLFLILSAIHLYLLEMTWASQQPAPQPGQDVFVLPTRQRLIAGITIGLIAMGLGGVLFYLRQLYLLRRRP
jgi:hypothetical protein